MKTGNPSRRAALFGGAAAALWPGSVWPLEREIEGGIGGTGIVGVITDFDPLIVAGQQITLEADTTLQTALGQAGPKVLALGESLTVEAASKSNGMQARRVSVTQPLVGVVTRRTESRATVNGIEVQMPKNASAADVGQRVSVSGLWQGRQVIASRVTPTDANLDVISGDVTRAGFGFFVGGVRIARLPFGPASGSFLTATGRYDPESNRLVVRRALPGRFTGAAGPLQRLAVEGYLEPTDNAPGFRVSGLGHSFAPNLRLDEFTEKRMLFTGAYTGDFAASAAVVLPEDIARRRRVLRAYASRGSRG